MRAGQFDRVEFFAGPDVEKVNRFAGGEPLRQLARLDLHRAIGCVAGENVFGHFLDVEIFVPRANAGERLVRAEAATRATADVIAAKERALRPGKLLEQLAHGDGGIDCCGGIHGRIKPKGGPLFRKMRRLWGAHAPRVLVWRLAERTIQADRSICAHSVRGEAPRTAREARALPRALASR